jgi:hypothetical protein
MTEEQLHVLARARASTAGIQSSEAREGTLSCSSHPVRP